VRKKKKEGKKMSRELTVNIGGTVDDKHYRYKRNVVELKMESKNGSQTRILNFKTIISQLVVSQLSKPERKKMESNIKIKLLSSLKKKFGMVNQDEKDSTIVIRKTVNVADVEKVVNDFIKKYILCPKCKLPELAKGECFACGHNQSSQSSSRQIETKQIDDDDEDKDEKNEETVDEKISEFLKEIYCFRDNHKQDQKIQEKIQSLVDECWDCESGESLEILKRKFSLVVE
jgi:translation initiation factor 2 beta subunit (eIF-2beta)/eIF-5